jgi:putative transposase
MGDNNGLNGNCRRWIGICRRELLDHIIVLNEAHLCRLLRDFISCYHDDRTHDSVKKDAPTLRPISCKPGPAARLVSYPRVGGLHHRYDWRQAA